jgi:hypothetical protein
MINSNLFLILAQTYVKRKIQNIFYKNGGGVGIFWHENSSLFNEFVCNLGFFWHEWASLKLE